MVCRQWYVYFSLVRKCVKVTFLWPKNVPFWLENDKQNIFLHCRISFSGMVATICETVLNESPFFGRWWGGGGGAGGGGGSLGPAPFYRKDTKRKKCINFFLHLNKGPEHQTFRSQKWHWTTVLPDNIDLQIHHGIAHASDDKNLEFNMENSSPASH